MSEPPDLSVVLATPGPYATVHRTIRALAAQTIAPRLELVLVRLGTAPLGDAPPELRGFAAVQVVPRPDGRSVAEGNAAGARRASAPVVAFAEDHSYPLPGWAEALVERHREPWAAVGPVVRNANPRTAVSWADYLLGYGPYAEGVAGGEVASLPGHNSSYKRETLLALGAELERWLEAEWVLHADLRARGERLYLEPRAVTRHVNFALLGVWLRTTAAAGRAFAAARRRHWGPARRIAFAAGAPLIPVVRAVRLRGLLRPARGAGAPLGRALPVLALGLLADGAGQLAGYAAGASNGPADTQAMEFERLRHLPEADRRSLLADEA